MKRVKLYLTIFIFSLFGYVCGVFVHSEFFHHWLDWLLK
jgi:ABC-type multidrug transport system permease subunit